MKSMTGYGISTWQSNNGYVEVVVQSYNSKNLDLRLQVSPFYTSLEGELRKEINTKFCRGVINMVITRSPLWPPKQTTVKWNKTKALQWKTLFTKIAQSLNIDNNIDVLNLTKQPGVLEVVSQVCAISVQEKSKLKLLIRKAVQKCNKERTREGVSIKKDFQVQLKKLLISIKKIESLWEKQKKISYKRLKTKIASTSLINEQKTLHENIGILINKLDINEEVNRMKEHIQAFSALVLLREPIGKKMAFYLQEMIRESNTIGSKSQDFKLTKEVIHTKSIIERMREQVQNVE